MQNNRRVSSFFWVTLLLVLIGTLASSVQAQEPSPFRINFDAAGGILNLRSGPGTGHNVLVAIPAGAEGIMVSYCVPADDGTSRYPFCEAEWSGYSGWLSSCCITAMAPAAPNKMAAVSQTPKSGATAFDLSGAWTVYVTPSEGVSQSCSDATFENCGEFEVIEISNLNPGLRVERSENGGHLYVTDPSGFTVSCPPNSWATSIQDDIRVRCRSMDVEEGIRIMIELNAAGFADSQMILQITHDLRSCRYTFRHEYAAFTQERFLAVCEAM